MNAYLVAKLALVAIGALVALAKGAQAVSVRAAARARMRGGQATLADQTVVTLSGTVRALGEPLIAPLSGTPCVMHRSVLRILGTALGQAGGVVAEHVAVEMVDFVLETTDGRVIVTGREAETTIRPGRIIPRELEREAAFLAARGVRAHARLVSCDEIVIEPGAKISVHGIARIEADASAAGAGEQGFRDTPLTTRLVGDERHPLTIASA